MVIAFFGTPQFAVPALERLLDSNHRVTLVITQPDRPRGRGQKVTDAPVKAAALARQVPVYQPDRLRDPEVAEILRQQAPDIGVVAAYGKLIPEHLLAIPRFGMINIHASLLPRYRGAAPVHRAVINGDLETGVTIMQVVKRLDAGDMLAKSVRPIGPDDTSDVVERGLAHDGAALLLEVLDRIKAGDVRPEPQDEQATTYADRLTKEEGLIDWSLSSRDIHNRVRGLYPWPHAYTYLDGGRLILLKTRVVDGSRREPEAVREPHATEAPGTIVAAAPDGIEVVTGSGTIVILELQPEGRRPMNTREFLAGRNVRAGTRFGDRL
jgi:methionyl-tRNA formyltransferase